MAKQARGRYRMGFGHEKPVALPGMDRSRSRFRPIRPIRPIRLIRLIRLIGNHCLEGSHEGARLFGRALARDHLNPATDPPHSPPVASAPLREDSPP